MRWGSRCAVPSAVAPNVRADVFTIGVLAYEMVTGRQPFRAASVPELLGQMLQVKPVPPSQQVSTVPAAVSAAVMRALAGDPASRFATAGDLLAAIREAP